MAVLNDKSKILSMVQLKKQLVDVPEWGKDAQVWVQELTASERDEYEQSLTNVRQKGRKTEVTPNFINSKARFAVKCIVDEKGERIFQDAEANKLGKLSSLAINRIVEVGYELSGMNKEDVEDLEENLSSAQSEDSPSS